MRESELLEHISRRSAGVEASGGWEVAVGPGDDAAVVCSPAGDVLLVTVDQLVEGRHYDPGTPIDLIARKAVARSVSDIAAMGGQAAWATATALLPKGYAHADELFDRMANWALHWGCPLIGGDIAAHAASDHPLTLTVTIAGTIEHGHSPVRRSGALPGDEVWVSGALGGSLASGRHLAFEPRVSLGRRASWNSSGVRAGIDLSDGLGRDAGRVARASGVRVRLEAGAVPLHPERAGDWRSACADGEDYELLLAIEPGRGDELAGESAAEGVTLTRIGACLEPGAGGAGHAEIVDPAGDVIDAGELGWDH